MGVIAAPLRRGAGPSHLRGKAQPMDAWARALVCRFGSPARWRTLVAVAPSAPPPPARLLPPFPCDRCLWLPQVQLQGMGVRLDDRRRTWSVPQAAK